MSQMRRYHDVTKGHCPFQAPPFSLQGNNHELQKSKRFEKEQRNTYSEKLQTECSNHKETKWIHFLLNLILFFVYALRLSLTELPWLAWNLLCRTKWPQVCRNPTVFPSKCQMGMSHYAQHISLKQTFIKTWKNNKLKSEKLPGS